MFNGKVSRRRLMQTAGVAALAPPLMNSDATAASMPENRFESKDTPKICLAIGDGGGAFVGGNHGTQGAAAGTVAANAASGGQPSGAPGAAPLNEEAAARRLKQLEVNYAIGGGGGPIPWDETRLKQTMERYKSYGLTIGNMMISGFDNAIYARPGGDEDIEKVKQSIQAAGKAGLAVVEYNWYAHRAMEGYFEEAGRDGAGWTGFDYERPVDFEGKKVPFKDLPPIPREGSHTLDEMWTNITYFLKAVVPVAEQVGVRLALHHIE
jgi:hypothetical protein